MPSMQARRGWQPWSHHQGPVSGKGVAVPAAGFCPVVLTMKLTYGQLLLLHAQLWAQLGASVSGPHHS